MLFVTFIDILRQCRLFRYSGACTKFTHDVIVWEIIFSLKKMRSKHVMLCRNRARIHHEQVASRQPSTHIRLGAKHSAHCSCFTESLTPQLHGVSPEYGTDGDRLTRIENLFSPELGRAMLEVREESKTNIVKKKVKSTGSQIKMREAHPSSRETFFIFINILLLL